MKLIKWIFIIAFFPLSLIFVAYSRRNNNDDRYDEILKQADDS